MQFLLDEDLPPEVAVIARGLGLDAVSVHELGRQGLKDDDHLQHAAAEERVFVTRNRDDFVRWTAEFFARQESHYGILIVTRRLPNTRPAAIAHAFGEWAAACANSDRQALHYTIHFL